jgi:hypothetical protein
MRSSASLYFWNGLLSLKIRWDAFSTLYFRPAAMALIKREDQAIAREKSAAVTCRQASANPARARRARRCFL